VGAHSWDRRDFEASPSGVSPSLLAPVSCSRPLAASPVQRALPPPSPNHAGSLAAAGESSPCSASASPPRQVRRGTVRLDLSFRFLVRFWVASIIGIGGAVVLLSRLVSNPNGRTGGKAASPQLARVASRRGRAVAPMHGLGNGDASGSVASP
jgi:hypothetical protein